MKRLTSESEQDSCIWSSLVCSPIHIICETIWLFILFRLSWHIILETAEVNDLKFSSRMSGACFGVCIKLCELWWKKTISCHHLLFSPASCRKWTTVGGIFSRNKKKNEKEELILLWMRRQKSHITSPLMVRKRYCCLPSTPRACQLVFCHDGTRFSGSEFLLNSLVWF